VNSPKYGRRQESEAGATGGARAKAQGAIIFLCVGQMSTITFSSCVQEIDVTLSKGRAFSQGIRGQSHHEGETLLAFERLVEAANLTSS